MIIQYSDWLVYGLKMQARLTGTMPGACYHFKEGSHQQKGTDTA